MTDTPTPPTPPDAPAANVSFRQYAFRSELDGVGSTHYYNGQIFIDDLHPAIQQPMAVRSASTFISGQVVAKRLAENAPFTVEDLAGELGGGVPLPLNDPRKDLLVVTAASILDTVWETMPSWASRLPEWLDEDLRDVVGTPDTPFPEIDPTIEGHAFQKVRLLYQARGGVFTLLAGLMFDYGSDHRWTFLLTNLTADDQKSMEAMKFVRRLLKFRNERTDLHAEAALKAIVLSVNDDIHDLVVAATNRAVPAANDDMLGNASDIPSDDED